MQVPTKTVWVVGFKSNRDGPVKLGTVDPRFLVVDDHQHVWTCVLFVSRRHDFLLHLFAFAVELTAGLCLKSNLCTDSAKLIDVGMKTDFIPTSVSD